MIADWLEVISMINIYLTNERKSIFMRLQIAFNICYMMNDIWINDCKKQIKFRDKLVVLVTKIVMKNCGYDMMFDVEIIEQFNFSSGNDILNLQIKTHTCIILFCFTLELCLMFVDSKQNKNKKWIFAGLVFCLGNILKTKN